MISRFIDFVRNVRVSGWQTQICQRGTSASGRGRIGACANLGVLRRKLRFRQGLWRERRSANGRHPVIPGDTADAFVLLRMIAGLGRRLVAIARSGLGMLLSRNAMADRCRNRRERQASGQQGQEQAGQHQGAI